MKYALLLFVVFVLGMGFIAYQSDKQKCKCPKYYIQAVKGYRHSETDSTVHQYWERMDVVPLDSVIDGSWYQIQGNYYPLNDTPQKIVILKQ